MVPEETPVAPTVAIETQGCKLNQADSEALARQFAQAGYRIVLPEKHADVYVVNTCTVTHIADRKARHALRAARRRHPNATIVATGCYAQRAAPELARMGGVDLVIENTAKGSLAQQAMSLRGEVPVPCAVGVEGSDYSPRPARTRAMVRIQEGCNQVCAYCIVPTVRGRERSVSADALVSQIAARVSEGYKEVVLTGTQLGSYGFDTPGVSLADLIGRILRDTSVERLRISSLQPQDISPGLLQLWSDPRLCPHFHMPLQSGSDSVLRRMRRRYTARLYAETVARIRAVVANVSITTDVLVGFPGETEEEFQETYGLCQSIGFAGMHVFPYSTRPGTSAAYLGNRAKDAVKARRVEAMLGLTQVQSAAFRRHFLGMIRPVLWEGHKVVDGSLVWLGLTDNYIRVCAQSPLLLTNQITPARLLEGGDPVYAQVL